MKLRIKSIITLVTMLLTGIGAFAQDGANSSPQYTVSYQYDGEASTSVATGIVECTFNGTTATIVCKPVEGNYITAEDIIVEKTVSGDKAQTREVGIDSTPITITAASTNTTPREQSAYTFTAEADPNLTYEIKANFHQLKDLDTYALIALPENTIYTYTGDAIKPEITVTATDVQLTQGTDYTVTYADNVNAGVGSITITATTTTFYKGTNTVNFDINQADVSFWFETSDGQEAKELTTTYGATFTKPVLKMSETGAADVIGVVYSVDNEEVATINATTGELTILKAGTVVVTAAAAEDYTNKDGSNYKADPTNTKTSYSLTINSATPTLQFSKETAEATMGAEFEAPTLTVSPEGLVPIEYESTNTEVATVDKNTGVVTLVGKGEATIKAVFPGNENYETALASYILTVSKATATLKFSAETATAIMGAEFAAPTLTVTPEGLQDVKYSSSNTNVATVNETTGVVTLVGAGEAVIKASFAGTTVYEAAEASYVLTVSKAKTELKFSSATATATMNAEFEAPILTKSPENLEGVEFTSSNEAAATVDKTTGAVTLVGAGETTIKAAFAGSTVYEASEASYTLTVNRAAGEGYLLWVNDTQVTSDNADDVLGHENDSSKPYYIYNKDKKQLYMDNDQTKTTVIESRMPELTVYIKDANKIKRIFFNNTGDTSNKGNLTFTTNGNFPGKLILDNSTTGESAIKGFSNISYNWDLTAIEPDGSYYDTTTLEMKYKKETEAIVIAEAITIGEAIVPITEKRAITFEESQLVEKDEDGKVKKDESGNPIKANLSNYSYAPSSTTGEPEKNVIHISLNSANISDDAGGFDIENGVGGIYIEDTMTDEKAGQVAQDVNDNKIVPGGTLYAESYDGFTFKLIAGSGTIEIDEIVENDHEFHLIIGINKPITLNENNSIIRPYDGKSVHVQAEIAFNVGAPTYCFLYMVKKTASTRLGKRDKAHGKLVSVQVRSTTVIPTEPPSEATGGVIPKSDDPEPETDPTPPTGIREVKSDKMAVKSGWYTIDGQKIAEPTQRGLYIKDGKKVVIK